MKKYALGIIVILILAVGGILAVRHHTKTQTPTKAAVQGSYVALGDSVAAGVGLSDPSDSSACDRTNQAYANTVAAGLNLKLTNLACSGATLPAGILGSQNVNNLMAPTQLADLFALPKPNLISLTIGANDAGWTTVIASCYTGVCGTSADSAGVNARLAVMSNNLKTALAGIQTHYGASVPHVVVTGYHQVFPVTSGSCADLTGVDAAEQAWGRQQQAALNATIQSVVSGFSFAVFAPVDFTGHELCSSSSWVQGLGDKEPYHPTADGQAEYARQVVASSKTFK